MINKWYTNTRPDANQGLIIEEKTGRNVAVSYDPKDAKLIALAPDMLEFIQAVSTAGEQGTDKHDSEELYRLQCIASNLLGEL